MRIFRVHITVLLLMMMLSGCRNVPPADDSFVPFEVERRIDKKVHWSQDGREAEQLKYAVSHLLQEELSVDSAVQIALLNNPQVQAKFEEIGIAHSDLIEAGLLSNPVFDLALRVPEKSGFRVNTEYSIVQNFIDLLLIPLRIKVASAELERVKLDVSKFIIDLAFDVEETFYHLAALTTRNRYLKDILELSEISNQIAKNQNRIANINPLDLQRRTALYLEKMIELAESEAEIIEVREKFIALLGINCPIQINSALPNIPKAEPPLSCLEEIAYKERLDIRSAKWHLEMFRRRFPTVSWWTFTDLQLGISSAREPDPSSPWTIGPAVAGKLPIFNYGQAAKKRLVAQYRMACAELQSIVVKANAEIREARGKMLTYRELVHSYVESVLPVHLNILNSVDKLYNVMGASIYELLDTKINQLNAQISYEMALKNYWISKVMLNRAIGGNIARMEEQ